MQVHTEPSVCASVSSRCNGNGKAATFDDDDDGYRDKIMSLDSASSWLKAQIGAQLATGRGSPSLQPHGSLECGLDAVGAGEGAGTPRPALLTSTVSCPSLLPRPISITVNDYSHDYIDEVRAHGGA